MRFLRIQRNSGGKRRNQRPQDKRDPRDPRSESEDPPAATAETGTLRRAEEPQKQ